MDFALNNLQWLICHKTKPNQTKPSLSLVAFTKTTGPIIHNYLHITCWEGRKDRFIHFSMTLANSFVQNLNWGRPIPFL